MKDDEQIIVVHGACDSCHKETKVSNFFNVHTRKTDMICVECAYKSWPVVEVDAALQKDLGSQFIFKFKIPAKVHVNSRIVNESQAFMSDDPMATLEFTLESKLTFPFVIALEQAIKAFWARTKANGS